MKRIKYNETSEKINFYDFTKVTTLDEIEIIEKLIKFDSATMSQINEMIIKLTKEEQEEILKILRKHTKLLKKDYYNKIIKGRLMIILYILCGISIGYIITKSNR